MHAGQVHVLVVCLTAGWHGCSESSLVRGEPNPGDVVEPAAEMKLVEMLDQAEASSALLGLPLDVPGDIATNVLLSLDFEGSQEKELGWQTSSDLSIKNRPGGSGRVLALRETKKRPPGIIVAVKPMEFYRVSRARRGLGSTLDLCVLEMRVRPAHKKLNHPSDLVQALGHATQAGSFVKLRALERQHAFAGQSTQQKWTKDDLIILTSKNTHSLLLTFQTPSSGRLEAGSVLIDDIEVHAMQPTQRQRLILLRDWHGMKAGNQATALHAFGQFLPLPAPGRASKEEELAFEHRHALIMPTPTSVRWHLPPGPAANLSFGLSLLQGSGSKARARFEVRFGGRSIFGGRLDETSARQWREHRLQIPGSAGTDATLVFESKSDEHEQALVVVSNPCIWRAQGNRDRPNVFLIAVDTLRADRTSAYGYSRPTSPALTELARDGVLFTHVTAQSNWTPESFASLFTSSYGAQHGVTDRLSVLKDNIMARTFRDAGYLTQAIIYKLLLYDMGFERGFDAYFNVPRFHLTKGYSLRAEMNWKRAKAWLNSHRQRRVFLFFHLNDPHQPFNQPRESMERFASPQQITKRSIELPVLINGKSVKLGGEKPCRGCVERKKFTPWFRQIASDLYDGEVYYVDKHVGLFVEELKALDLYDDSLVVFLSDHGEGLAEHNDFIGHGFHYLHEEQIRVPLLIKPPRNSGLLVGSRVDAPVRLLDVLPTLVEMAKLRPLSGLEGESLLPLMRGESRPQPIVVAENVRSRAIALRDGSLKYSLRFVGKSQVEQLFDLARDPGETTNLVSKAELGASLRGMRIQAARHLARTHPGTYILVSFPSKAREQNLWLSLAHGPGEIVPVMGRVGAKPQKGRQVRSFAGMGAVLLARMVGGRDKTRVALRLTEGKRLLGSLTSPELGSWPTFQRSEPTHVKRYAKVRWIRNPVEVKTNKRAISGEELEALRALGYVEN